MALSRMLAAILLLVPAPTLAVDTAEAALARAAERTGVTVRCTAPKGDAIIVCGRRAADRWRVPFVGDLPGDRAGESVSDERNRLASEPHPPCGTTAFLSGCGFVGLTYGGSFGGTMRVRPVAD